MNSAERKALRRAGRALGRFVILSTMVAGVAGLALFHAAAARPAGDCSVASAPLITSGATQTSDPGACPDGRQYSAMDLEIGDTLNITPGAGAHIAFATYGPDAQAAGRALCEQNSTVPDTLRCLIPAAGRYVLVTTGSGSFTPAVKQVPAQADRVAGACSLGAAPIIRAPVTQYGNSNLCERPAASQYWKIDVRPGDKLSVNITPFNLYGGSISLGVYGPNSGTTAGPLCIHRYSGPGVMNCPIRRSGRYVLATTHEGSFTPLVTHPTRPVLTTPRSIAFGRAIQLAVAIGSNTAYPTGTCVVEENILWTWSPILRVHPTTGTCSARIVPDHRGAILLRVHFEGMRGWASSTSNESRVQVL